MINESVEYRALACMLNDPSLLYTVPVDYFTEPRATLLRAMRDAWIAYGTLTIEGIERFYQRPVDGAVLAAYATDLEPLTDELHRLWKKRNIKDIADRLYVLATEHDPHVLDVEDYVAQLQQELHETSLVYDASHFLAELEQKRNGTYEFVSTGIGFLDAMQGGEWPKGELSFIAALPGTGKTALCLNSMLRMAQNGHASLFFSLEMNKQALLGRWCADIVEIDSDTIKRGKLSETEYKRIEQATQYITTLPMYVIDTPSLTVTEMGVHIREYVRDKHIKVVFIDYLQIVNIGEKDKNSGLGDVAKALKVLAKKLNIHICVLAQAIIKDGGMTIRDTGEAQAHADMIITLKTETMTGDVKTILIDYTKFRNGKTGYAPVLFNGRFQRFIDGTIG
jgi:replicative DNA helicase